MAVAAAAEAETASEAKHDYRVRKYLMNWHGWSPSLDVASDECAPLIKRARTSDSERFMKWRWRTAYGAHSKSCIERAGIKGRFRDNRNPAPSRTDDCACSNGPDVAYVHMYLCTVEIMYRCYAL